MFVIMLLIIALGCIVYRHRDTINKELAEKQVRQREATISFEKQEIKWSALDVRKRAIYLVCRTKDHEKEKKETNQISRAKRLTLTTTFYLLLLSLNKLHVLKFIKQVVKESIEEKENKRGEVHLVWK